MVSRIWLATLSCCLLYLGGLHSQCTITGPLAIPDDGVLTVEISTSGLINSNLASPTQGICGVEINFVHEYLGDLTVSLISPSGTMVQLIGPTTTTTGSTNLANWHIDFNPCGSPASPDAGFADVWSNQQPWQTLSFYSGTYHPNSGCLEDFNTGPANGIWQVIFEDHDQFQIGSVESITLIFCDTAGLNCTPCNPNAGTLSPTSFSICSGQNIQSGDISIDYGGNTPSPQLYSYEYLFVSGNTIIQSGAAFSISPPVGSYNLCGLSYLTADTTTINALIDDGDYALLLQAIDNDIVCADTGNCIALEVVDKPDTVTVTMDLCNGEIFTYGGQSYTTDGVFYQLHDGPGLCDTIHEIRIVARTLDVTINPTDTLTCGNGSVDIQAMATGAFGPFTFLWTTVNGNIITSPDNAFIQVDQAGQYFVEVTDGVCDGSGSVQVLADQGFPQVFFEGGTLSCNNPAIDIEPIFIPSDGTILWTGPSGFNTTQPNITITSPGTYQLRVTNAAGCTTTRSVDIGIDTTTNPINVIVLGKDCINGTITLGDENPHWLNGWNWTGPNMFTTDNWRPVVSTPGLYTLTGRFANGCTRSASYLFDGDFTIPDIAISPTDTLNCNEVIPLTITSNTPGVTFAWTGPQGFSSQLPLIMVSQSGVYTGTVTALNGCIQTGNVNIELGDDVFDYEVITDTITCAQSLITIGVVAPGVDFYDWLNYSGPGDDSPFIEVGAGGIYQVLMRDNETNCEVLAQVPVYTNLVAPYFIYSTDTISCNHPIAELNFIPVQGFTYASVYWELPDLTIVQGQTVMSGLAGNYFLYAVGSNGCVQSRQIQIPFDTLRPFVILETDTLLCLDTVQIISQSLDSIASYQWSGPGIINSFSNGIDVNEPGLYHLSAVGLNGCPAEHDIIVDSNFIKPSFALTADSLQCNVAADLVVTPVDPVLNYSWFDANELLISNDSIASVILPGRYRVEVQGLNQCISYDTVILNTIRYPVISLEADTITCLSPSANVMVDIDIPQYTLAWVDLNNDTISTAGSLVVTNAGPFIASVSGTNTCESRDTILVTVDTIPPVALISLTGEVKCKNRDAILDGTASAPVPLSYSWTTLGGNILSDPTLVQINVRDTGYYYLSVQSLDNGCMDSISFHLIEDPDAITQAHLDIVPPACHGDEVASITVASLDGGVAPFQYQLDGSAFQSSPAFTDLDAGTFLITITDADQCEFDTTVVIEPTPEFSVDAGPDQEIYLGETAQLTGITIPSQDNLITDSWTTAGSLLCSDCPQFDIIPNETTTYTYQVTTGTGCVREDEMIVYVIEKGKYYLPNVFSPNGDGINDEIRIIPSPGVQLVLQWVVFDRWGNAVYGKTDFQPTDPSVFWDGRTSTGEEVNPGVFAYILEIQLINGKVEVHHGDITVIR